MVKPGDMVRIITTEETIEGVYMEKPRLLGTDTIILKLANGYNMGIDKKKVKQMKVLKEYTPKRSKKKVMKTKKDLPTVLILSTGGTISSKVDYTTGGVVAEYTAEDFVSMIPELSEIANVKAMKVMEIMSEDVTPLNVQEIAQSIAKEIENVDGIVVTMGTDVLHYIAAGLSFALTPSKPVVITGAQKSIDRPSSDAFFNLLCAVHAAAKWDGAEVVTCMHGSTDDDHCILIRGTKVRKMHTSRRDAFRPVNAPALAVVKKDSLVVNKEATYRKRSKTKTKIDAGFSEHVGIVTVYPGINPKIIESFAEYQGLIIMGTGLGHVPLNLIPTIKKLTDHGVFVGITSQCLYGRVSSTVYSGLRKLAIEGGAVHLEDMLPETAFMKLSWVCNKEKDVEKIKALMLKNVSGEFEERIDVKEFLS